MSIIDAIRERIADNKIARMRREVPEMFAALEHERNVQRVARHASDVLLAQSVLASCLTYARRDIEGDFSGEFSGDSDAIADALLDRLLSEGWELRKRDC